MQHVLTGHPTLLDLLWTALTIVLCFNRWKTADIQAHSAAPSAALRACRSAVFERNCDHSCKPLKKEKGFYGSGALTFSCEGPPKWYVFGHGPPSQNISFQGPPRSKIWVTNVRFENTYIQRFAHIFTTFSKIADLQARSAALGAALWACISAIFQ